jgi:hypothetical protein
MYHTAMNPSQSQLLRPRALILAALAGLLLFAGQARAIVFQYGDLKGSFDTTFSVGGLVRLANPDPALYGLTNTYNGVHGQQYSVNADDGDLNYRRGLASLLLKGSNDLQLDYHNAGIFVRGYYFNDFVNSDGTRPKIPLSPQAESIVAQGGELLDAYAYYKPMLGDMPASIRVGKQVLSWGESTFIPNGINSINPIDVAKLRTPGSELKEALLPVNMVSGSVSVTSEITLEAFYLLNWKSTRIDPPGTYFSTNDFVAPGGKKVYLGFGQIADSSALGAINRGPDRDPQNSGQWGVNLRWLAHGLGETEFGFYFMNYHSRLPFVSAVTPTAGVSPALVQATAGALGQANLLPALIPVFGAGSGTALTTLLGAALTGVPKAALPANLQPFYPAAQSIASGAKTVGFLTAAATGQYEIVYPSDIHLFGASFNTSVSGIALQGEVSYRDNQPLQVDDVELLFAALSPLNPAYGSNNQIGNFAGQFSTYIPGFRRQKVWTGQVTATKAARGILGAQQSTFVAEIGFVSASLPSKDVLRFDAPGTYRAGSLSEMTNTGNGALGADPASAFADSFSWGYQLVGRLDYNNLFAGVNVSPLLVFSHDVGGITPLPLGNFRAGRKTITLGADFTFQQQWALELRYVNFVGADRFNLLSDRDYVSATVKYSF